MRSFADGYIYFVYGTSVRLFQGLIEWEISMFINIESLYMACLKLELIEIF